MAISLKCQIFIPRHWSFSTASPSLMQRFAYNDIMQCHTSQNIYVRDFPDRIGWMPHLIVKVDVLSRWLNASSETPDR